MKWIELLTNLLKKALEIRGYNVITEDEEDRGEPGISVTVVNDAEVKVGGWMEFNLLTDNSLIVTLYKVGRRGALVPSDSKAFEDGHEIFAVSWAMGKMFEAELVEML